MESQEFYELVSGYFGAKAIQKSFTRSTGVFTCTLYESFRFECGLDGEHGTFTGGIEFAPDKYFTTFFDQDLSLNTDSDSILRNLQVVDEWCRLRLPDKFLQRYEAALASRDDE